MHRAGDGPRRGGRQLCPRGVICVFRGAGERHSAGQPRALGAVVCAEHSVLCPADERARGARVALRGAGGDAAVPADPVAVPARQAPLQRRGRAGGRRRAQKDRGLRRGAARALRQHRPSAHADGGKSRRHLRPRGGKGLPRLRAVRLLLGKGVSAHLYCAQRRDGGAAAPRAGQGRGFPLVLFRAVHPFFVVFVGRERRAARLSSAAAVPAAAGGRPREGGVAVRPALRAHAERGGRRAAPRVDAAGAFLRSRPVAAPQARRACERRQRRPL